MGEQRLDARVGPDDVACPRAQRRQQRAAHRDVLPVDAPLMTTVPLMRRPYATRVEPLEGIAAADAHLGRRVPLPAAALPLARWVEVTLEGPGAVEVEWNLDDTRGGPARLTLMVSLAPPATQLPGAPERRAGPGVLREAPLDEAQASLRPVRELIWEHDGLHLRLTGQGPWEEAALVAVAATVG
jgi:hypothetical protein